jgi:hypothetical protein
MKLNMRGVMKMGIAPERTTKVPDSYGWRPHERQLLRYVIIPAYSIAMLCAGAFFALLCMKAF